MNEPKMFKLGLRIGITLGYPRNNMFLGVERSRLGLGQGCYRVKATAIRCGFELYAGLLVITIIK